MKLSDFINYTLLFVTMCVVWFLVGEYVAKGFLVWILS